MLENYTDYQLIRITNVTYGDAETLLEVKAEWPDVESYYVTVYGKRAACRNAHVLRLL